MNRLAQLVKELDYDNLLAIRRDITEGNMLRLVEERIASFENPNKVCPICGAGVDPEKATTIYFGAQGLRQRASFDGEDCLRHFLEKNKV